MLFGSHRCLLAASAVFYVGLFILGINAEEPLSGQGDGFSWSELVVGELRSDGFRPLAASETGIAFTNHLSEASAERNRILENGSGVTAGDVDGDGLVDLYFCRLEGDNVLYRNLGGLRFEDITAAAGVSCEGQMSTGAVLADVDGDRDLDLLVTGVSAGARCFLNDSRGGFTELTSSGLDQGEGSMSMALADADQDGDLDLYVANYRNITWKDLPPGVKPRVTRTGGKPIAAPRDRFVASLRENGSTAITEIGQPDAFYLNDGDAHFSRVDWLGGRFLDEDGKPLKLIPRHWGLSVAFRDFNGDRLPDLYVCNDFLYGNDDFFLNQGGGTFRRIARNAVRHSSWSAMAVDVADINRDGHFDFMVVDMLSQNLTRRLTQRANNETGSKLREVGLILDRPQQQHNSLYLNRGDGSFTEIAHLAGVEASEWSWSMAFLDVDLDGYEDLLIGNGHAHDLLDGDVTMDAMHAMRSAPRGKVPRTLLMYPRLDLPDVAFRNRGDLTFDDVSEDWGFNVEGVSSSMCRADLDQDGDWDVVVNRLQSEALVLENTGGGSRVSVSLSGQAKNTMGAGALVRLIPIGSTRLPEQGQEMVVGGRYLASDETALVFAGGELDNRFRLEVDWPSGARSIVDDVRSNRSYRIEEASDSITPSRVSEKQVEIDPWFRDVSSMIAHSHHDRHFNDLARQPLLPRLLSQLGPGVSWADLDSDGFDDLIVPGGVTGRLAVLMNSKGRGFEKSESEPLSSDQTGGIWLNVSDETFQYIVGSSNYEHGLRSHGAIEIRGMVDGALTVTEALSGQMAMVGPVVSLDYDSDGDLDLFVGGRVNPGRYPEPAISRLYRNDRGRFRLDLDNSRSFVDLGLVSGALASDLDGDGDSDLAMALEWGAIRVWLNDSGVFTDASEGLGLLRYRGWWNGIAAGDFDEDGRIDLIASNWGRNTKYERYRNEPIRIAYGDIDRSSTVEIFEQVYDTAASRWGALRDLIVMGAAIPSLQNRTHSYREFAERGLEWAFGAGVNQLSRHEVNWLDATVFLNRGETFSAVALPIEAQFAPSFGLVVGDFDGDGHEDVFLSQNFFATQPETPRYDAGLGLMLQGRGDGSFSSIPADVSGLRMLGEQRGAASSDFDRDGRLDLVVTQNGAQTHLYRNTSSPSAHRVRLVGPLGNRQALGAKLRLLGEGDSLKGPLREIRVGSGYWSQNGLTSLWPVTERNQILNVIWPGGRQSEVIFGNSAEEMTISYPESVE